MKRCFLLLFIVIILSGCSVQRIDKSDFTEVMNKVLSLDIKYHNKVSNGYLYYVPKGVNKVDSKSYNDVLTRDKYTYYLYADIVRYYYKTNEEYKINNLAYYSSLIEKNNKKGYIEITKNNDKLYIQMFYNYAKIETYIDEKDLNQVISDLSYILSSIKFNDSLLKKEYSNNYASSKEETYKLFNNKEKEGNFIEYIKEYDKYDDSKKEEETKIDIKTTTTTSKEK